MECRSCSGEEKLAGKKANCLILRLAQEWDPSKAQHPVEWHLKVLVCTTRRLRQKQELLADAAASRAQNKALLQPVGGVCCLPSPVGINYRFEKGYSNLRAGFEASGEFERFVLVKECLRSLSIPHTDHNSREALLGVHRSNQEHIIITNHTPQLRSQEEKELQNEGNQHKLKAFVLFCFGFGFRKPTFILTTRISASTNAAPVFVF